MIMPLLRMTVKHMLLIAYTVKETYAHIYIELKFTKHITKSVKIMREFFQCLLVSYFFVLKGLQQSSSSTEKL